MRKNRYHNKTFFFAGLLILGFTLFQLTRLINESTDLPLSTSEEASLADQVDQSPDDDSEIDVQTYVEKADEGDTEAPYQLGKNDDQSEEADGNKEATVEWLTKAAEQGDAEAQYNLGQCYYHGKGVEENKEIAVQWFTKAAEQDNADGCALLGICYLNGYGVAKNKREGQLWLGKAADSGHDGAKRLLALSKKPWWEVLFFYTPGDPPIS